MENNSQIKTREILDRWPHTSLIAEDLGMSSIVTRRWKERGRIPAEHDIPLLGSAAKRGIALSLEELAFARLNDDQLGKKVNACQPFGVSKVTPGAAAPQKEAS